ncbi:MAG: hypothetical protein KJ052_01960 [Candidatus Hydrogenedentes bacterium]|nr:hypothetical protein [Candidatus Hydrogenedentota bacterium]
MMSRLKQFTEILTPLPFRRERSLPSPVLAVERHDVGPTIKPLLKEIVTASSVVNPEAERALSRLKRFVRLHDAYVVGMALKIQLQSMPRVDDAGKVYHKCRAYVLVADLFLVHIQLELKNMSTAGECLGTNTFRGYCNEVVECLIGSKDLSRAVEVPVMLADELLLESVQRPKNGLALVCLAQEAMRCARRLLWEHNEHVQRLNRKRHTVASKRTVAFSLPDAMQYMERIENVLVDVHAKELCHVSGTTVGEQNSERRLEHIEELNALLPAIDLRGYRPWAAIIKEALATEAPLQSQQRLWESAAKDYEVQGDFEKKLHLFRLCRRRYEKAGELYKRFAPVRAKRINAKLYAVQNQGQSSVL